MSAPAVSLTGDPTTDALVPIAARLVGAVRDHDPEQIEQALADAILATGGRCDPAVALAVVCAAMVPDDVGPSRLLAWHRVQAEYLRLIGSGIRSGIARQLAGIERKAS